MGKEVTLSFVLATWSGYGQLTCEVFSGLKQRGWDVVVKPLRIEEPGNASVPLEIKECIDYGRQTEKELLIASFHPFPSIPTPGKRTALWTMWESIVLPPASVAVCNMAPRLIVPCEWNREIFRSGGITTPMDVVPLGINPTIFSPSPVPTTGNCVFGAGGSLGSSWRKQLDVVIEGFQMAFPHVDDVRLKLKILPGESLNVDDKRIEVCSDFMPWHNLARWYSSLTAFVNVGTEGWGLMPHQAMASGRPVIVPFYGGSMMYLNREASYEMDYTLNANKLPDMTAWSVMAPDVKSLRDQMRRVYLDRTEAAEKGVASADSAHRFTWENTIDELEEVLATV